MRKEELLASEFLKESRIQNFSPKRTYNTNLSQDGLFKTGTTTVGLICKDCVILGTDKRATMAYFVASKTAEKLHHIQDHLYITLAGSVADGQYLIDILRANTTLYQLEKNKPVPVKTAGRLLSNILYRYKMFPFQVGHILGGVTEEEGPVLLNIGAYGSILPEKYVAVGSGQNFSYGVLEAKYKEGLSIDDGKKIIKKAITSSIIRDMASGNGIDIAVIKENEPAVREFTPI